MSSDTKGVRSVLPADHPAYAKLRCVPPGPTAEERRMATKLMAHPEARAAALEELRQEGKEQGDLANPDSRPDEVPTLLIVDDVEHVLRKYLILPPVTYLIVALWAIGTYFTHSFDTFGYLFLTSPTPECGKSRVQEVLELICWKPWRGTAISENALFRMLVGSPPPTILFDECGYLGKGRQGERGEAIISILNSGYRQGQTVPRCVAKGKDFQIEHFPTFGPKCLAGIGKALPQTIVERSFVVEMQKRAPHERIARFIHSLAKDETAPLRKSLRRDMTEHAERVKAAYLTLGDLPFLGDRDAEIARPLFALARVFYPSREGELENCLKKMCASKAIAAEDDSLPLRLLSDLKHVWTKNEQSAFSKDLLQDLTAIEEAPWGREVSLNARSMARKLSGFDMRPRSVRVGDATGKGYTREQLDKVWSAYLPEGVLSVTASQPASEAANNDAPCDGVTDVTDVAGTGGRSNDEA